MQTGPVFKIGATVVRVDDANNVVRKVTGVRYRLPGGYSYETNHSGVWWLPDMLQSWTPFRFEIGQEVNLLQGIDPHKVRTVFQRRQKKGVHEYQIDGNLVWFKEDQLRDAVLAPAAFEVGQRVYHTGRGYGGRVVDRFNADGAWHYRILNIGTSVPESVLRTYPEARESNPLHAIGQRVEVLRRDAKHEIEGPLLVTITNVRPQYGGSDWVYEVKFDDGTTSSYAESGIKRLVVDMHYTGAFEVDYAKYLEPGKVKIDFSEAAMQRMHELGQTMADAAKYAAELEAELEAEMREEALQVGTIVSYDDKLYRIKAVTLQDGQDPSYKLRRMELVESHDRFVSVQDGTQLTPIA